MQVLPKRMLIIKIHMHENLRRHFVLGTGPFSQQRHRILPSGCFAARSENTHKKYSHKEKKEKKMVLMLSWREDHAISHCR